jgi:hypothetical protein
VLKGRDHQINIFFKAYKSKLVLSVHAQMVLKFGLLKRKLKIKFLLASFKTITNSKDCSESCIRISILAFLLSHWSIFSGVPVSLSQAAFETNFRITLTGGCQKPKQAS